MRLEYGRFKRGYILPTLVMLTMVLLVLTGAVLQLGTAGLRTATLDHQTESAVYAAESGLVEATDEYITNGPFTDAYVGTLPENSSSYKVEAYANDGPGELSLPNGVSIPEGTVYFLSTGTSQNGTNRTCGALFRKGLGSFQVGGLADNVVAVNSTFDAYDSSKEAAGWSGSSFDPAAAQVNRAILASNKSSGNIYDLKDSNVLGSIFVGPGGDPTAQVTKAGNTVVSSVDALTDPIKLEDIVVPTLPPGASGSSTGSTPPVVPVGSVQLGGLAVTGQADGSVKFSNSCFAMTLKPNGDFVATENPDSSYAGGALKTVGNVNDLRSGGALVSSTGYNRNGGSGFQVSVTTDGFGIAGSWHHFAIQSDGSINVDLGPSGGIVGNTTTGSLNTVNTTAPSWLAGLFTQAPAELVADDPSVLEPGSYDEVNIETVNAKLVDNGTYVIKRLNVTGSGTLELPTGADNVVLYVTDKLSVEGENAIVNATRKSPNLTIYYTGTEPVKLAGGSKSFYTLQAQSADVSLIGAGADPTEFFGALVGKTLNVENANFHYDVATSGVGTGASASVLKLLSRHR